MGHLLGHLLGHLQVHLDHETAWQFLGSGIEGGMCCIPTKVGPGFGIGFVKLGSHSSFCTLCIHSDILSRWGGAELWDGAWAGRKIHLGR